MNKRDHVGVKAGEFPNGEEYFRAVNKTTTKGGELAIGGRLNDRWLLNASYAHSKIKDSEGKQLHPSYPVHLFKLFTAYDVTDRLNLGANVNWAKPQPYAGRISRRYQPGCRRCIDPTPIRYAGLDRALQNRQIHPHQFGL